MSSREDDQFYSLGFTTPEQMEEIQEDHRRPHRRPRKIGRVVRPSAVRDFESDRGHPEMDDLPDGFVDEPYDGEPIQEPRLVTRIIARRNHEKSIREQFGVDSPEYRKLQRYNEEHPLLPDIDHPKGA